MRARSLDWNDHEQVRLEHLSRVLEGALAVDRAIPQVARQVVRGGKRIRSRLLFASMVEDGTEVGDAVVRAAAALELFHAASLIHDDIVDECVRRRGRPAVHVVIGAGRASLVGGLLVQMTFSALADLPRGVRVRFAQVGQQLSRGEFTELLHVWDTDLRPDDRLAIITDKTASLFGLACELGGLLSGAEDVYRSGLRRFGEGVGSLYQIADDLNDLLAPPTELGRVPGADLRGGIVSLPVACGLEAGRAGEIAAIFDEARDGDLGVAVTRCVGVLRESGAFSQLRSIVGRCVATVRHEQGGLKRCRGARWMSEFSHRLVTAIDMRLRLADR